VSIKGILICCGYNFFKVKNIMNTVSKDVWKMILEYCYSPKIRYGVVVLNLFTDEIDYTSPLCETQKYALVLAYDEIEALLWDTVTQSPIPGFIPVTIGGDTITKSRFINEMISTKRFELEMRCVILQLFEIHQ